MSTINFKILNFMQIFRDILRQNYQNENCLSSSVIKLQVESNFLNPYPFFLLGTVLRLMFSIGNKVTTVSNGLVKILAGTFHIVHAVHGVLFKDKQQNTVE